MRRRRKEGVLLKAVLQGMLSYVSYCKILPVERYMVLVWALEAMGSFYRRGRGKSNERNEY